MENNRFTILLENYLASRLTPAEAAELAGLLEESSVSGELGQLVETQLNAHFYDQEIALPVTAERIQAGLQSAIARRPASVHFLKTAWLRYAAILLLIAGTAAYLYTSSFRKNPDALAHREALKPQSILPGTNKATLTVDDQSIDLASGKSGITVGNTITYTDGEKLADIGKMLMLATPKGGQYRIVLPDGSRVWLNAASSIRFPAAFAGARRDVVITGEVYMEIAQNEKQPFVVNAEGTEIQVLGTSFNINDYKEEGALKTTLISGSVKVVSGPSPVVLKPGQQAVVSAGAIRVQDTDTEQALAWKNGLFNFEGLELPAVMRQLERWYDIQVRYESARPKIIFQGEMYRSAQLSDVLDALQTMGVKFRLEGKTLVIM